ncbi:MAG: hypothetical protein JNL97_14905 [Verrucomicrobiales bacterium]|nr:hypothetical protein [Verrucomicrobiales bacterium]
MNTATRMPLPPRSTPPDKPPRPPLGAFDDLDARTPRRLRRLGFFAIAIILAAWLIGSKADKPRAGRTPRSQPTDMGPR